MKITTKGVQIENRAPATTSPYLRFGVHVLKINAIETVKAATGTPKAIFRVESEPIQEEGFQPLEGAKGQVGTIASGWLKTDEQQEDFVRQVCEIAEAMNLREEVDTINVTNIEDFINKLNEVLCGKYARFVVATEQYFNTNGKLRDSFKFPRYRFVEAISVPDAKSTLYFDKSKTYHFKPAEEVTPDAENDSVPVTKTEEPF